jgi:hypothetical protein
VAKVRIFLCTLVAVGLFGCSQDPNEKAVADTISTLQDTTRVINAITSILNKEIEAAKKDEAKGMDVTKLADAKAEAENLKKKAEDLQRIKALTDSLREGMNAEQRKKLAEKHKDAFQQAANDLGLAERNLEKSLKDAEELTKREGTSGQVKEAMKLLRETLANSQKEFAVMNKRQT